MNTFAITCDHPADGIGTPIYVQGYLVILAVDVAAAEDCQVQSLPVLLLDFRFNLANKAEMFENFVHFRGSCICTEEMLSGFQPASRALVA